MADVVFWDGSGFCSETSSIDISSDTVARLGTRSAPDLLEDKLLLPEIFLTAFFFLALQLYRSVVASHSSSRPRVRPLGRVSHPANISFHSHTIQRIQIA